MKKLTRPRINAFLHKYASEAERVLDIGAGRDDHRSDFPNRITLDIDPARKPDVVGDAQELPFPDGSFEVVVCSEVLEHIPDPQLAIKEMNRVLVEGGMVVLTTRFAFPVHDAPGDYWRFTPYGLKRLFSDWNILEFAPDGGPFYAIAVQLQRIAFQTHLKGGKLTKAFLYGLAFLFARLDFLVVAAYGDIGKTATEAHLLSSGVFIASRKV